jgi:hypothetical protein
VSRDLDLFVGGSLGAWALQHAPVPLVRQVVCLDDELIALAAELGHDIFAGDPCVAGFTAGRAALSVDFPLILDAALVARYRGAIWNLHAGLLPSNRGLYPAFWALWEGTPAGATLHELTAAVCAGPIVEQTRVSVLPSDTGGRLHERVEGAQRALYQRWLPRLASGELPPVTPQAPGGSHHSLAEFEYLRDEGRYEVPRGERERLGRCLSFAESRDLADVPQTRWRSPS